MTTDQAQVLSDAAAIYRHQGDSTTALKLEAVLYKLDNGRAVRVVDLEAAIDLAVAVVEPDTERGVPMSTGQTPPAVPDFGASENAGPAARLAYGLRQRSWVPDGDVVDSALRLLDARADLISGMSRRVEQSLAENARLRQERNEVRAVVDGIHLAVHGKDNRHRWPDGCPDLVIEVQELVRERDPARMVMDLVGERAAAEAEMDRRVTALKSITKLTEQRNRELVAALNAERERYNQLAADVERNEARTAHETALRFQLAAEERYTQLAAKVERVAQSMLWTADVWEPSEDLERMVVRAFAREIRDALAATAPQTAPPTPPLVLNPDATYLLPSDEDRLPYKITGWQQRDDDGLLTLTLEQLGDAPGSPPAADPVPDVPLAGAESALDLDAIRVRAAHASGAAGWLDSPPDRADEPGREDHAHEVILASANDVPDLIDEIDRLHQENDETQEQLNNAVAALDALPPSDGEFEDVIAPPAGCCRATGVGSQRRRQAEDIAYRAYVLGKRQARTFYDELERDEGLKLLGAIHGAGAILDEIRDGLDERSIPVGDDGPVPTVFAEIDRLRSARTADDEHLTALRDGLADAGCDGRSYTSWPELVVSTVDMLCDLRWERDEAREQLDEVRMDLAAERDQTAQFAFNRVVTGEQLRVAGEENNTLRAERDEARRLATLRDERLGEACRDVEALRQERDDALEGWRKEITELRHTLDERDEAWREAERLRGGVQTAVEACEKVLAVGGPLVPELLLEQLLSDLRTGGSDTTATGGEA